MHIPPPSARPALRMPSGQTSLSSPPSSGTTGGGVRSGRKRHRVQQPLRNPQFLGAILDEATLAAILRFNASSLPLLARRDTELRLRALQRDPEYVLAFLKEPEVVCVLAEFWTAWVDDTAAVAAARAAAGCRVAGGAAEGCGRAPAPGPAARSIRTDRAAGRTEASASSSGRSTGSSSVSGAGRKRAFVGCWMRLGG